LDRAVGAVAKPLGVLLDVGMVGGALEGDIEGQFDPMCLGGLDELSEVVERSQLRMNRLVAPSGPPIPQGLPTSPGVACGALFRPLRNVLPIGWIGGR
jgi:hypothetical protein